MLAPPTVGAYNYWLGLFHLKSYGRGCLTPLKISCGVGLKSMRFCRRVVWADMGTKPQLTKPKPKSWPMLEAEAKAEATAYK